MRRACGLLVFLLAWLLIGHGTAGVLSQASWRPYANPSVLITLGMSKGEVLVKAGKPVAEELVSLGIAGSPSITVWTYIRSGHNAAVTTLTFRGPKLVKIETRLLKP
ncbi:MAG: hypothetical protein KatS3mg131_3729 [Candidatus Tectimicrobiota bacterium]|nr:MAG: hypothetical protein KatS3mg131_3729 [Candidatus Tectomicrobia bacterium]